MKQEQTILNISFDQIAWQALLFDNGRILAQAFIPNTNATTQQACYIEYYNGLSSMSSLCIQQLPLNNVWVYITYQSLYSIRRIDLGNGNDRSNTAKIAWDEVWVHN